MLAEVGLVNLATGTDGAELLRRTQCVKKICEIAGLTFRPDYGKTPCATLIEDLRRRSCQTPLLLYVHHSDIALGSFLERWGSRPLPRNLFMIFFSGASLLEFAPLLKPGGQIKALRRPFPVAEGGREFGLLVAATRGVCSNEIGRRFVDIDLNDSAPPVARSVAGPPRAELAAQWHDLRNAVRMLTGAWGLLAEDPRDSWAFASEGYDHYSDLADSSGTLREKALRIRAFLSDAGDRRHSEMESVLAVFCKEPGTSPILALFRRYPAPRHPRSHEAVSRERYAGLVRDLLAPECEETMNRLLRSVEQLDAALAPIAKT